MFGKISSNNELIEKSSDKKVVFISGPITGVENYMTKFMEAEDLLKERGYIVINPARINSMIPENAFSYEEMLEFDLKYLSHCSHICMLPGWEKSEGAKRELVNALMKSKEIIVL